MTEANDSLDPSLDPNASADPDATASGTTEPDPIVQARKRQAGAEAARLVAEKKLQTQQEELDALRAKNQTAAEAELSELARERTLREAAEKRATDAEKAAEARILDKLYPKARAGYPEVTDEAKLANLEALLDDDEGTEASVPTPRGVNPPRGTTSARPAAGSAEETSADVLARLKGIPIPWN